MSCLKRHIKKITHRHTCLTWIVCGRVWRLSKKASQKRARGSVLSWRQILSWWRRWKTRWMVLWPVPRGRSISVRRRISPWRTWLSQAHIRPRWIPHGRWESLRADVSLRRNPWNRWTCSSTVRNGRISRSRSCCGWPAGISSGWTRMHWCSASIRGRIMKISTSSASSIIPAPRRRACPRWERSWRCWTASARNWERKRALMWKCCSMDRGSACPILRRTRRKIWIRY